MNAGKVESNRFTGDNIGGLVIGAGVIGVGLALGAMLNAPPMDKDIKGTYGDSFIDPGKCMDESPYATKNGATLEIDHKERTLYFDTPTTLRIHPSAETSTQQLTFDVELHGFNRPKLVPADHYTGNYLRTSDC